MFACHPNFGPVFRTFVRCGNATAYPIPTSMISNQIFAFGYVFGEITVIFRSFGDVSNLVGATCAVRKGVV